MTISAIHATTAAPALALDIPAIKARHVELYDQVQQAKEHLKKDPSRRDQTRQDLDAFIDLLRNLSRYIARTNDYSEYDWLETAATKWQEFFSWIMTEPRNIRSEIEMPDRPKSRVRSRERAELPGSAIKADIDNTAFFIGADRKIRILTARIQELREIEKGKYRIHHLMPSTLEEQLQDWEQALVYFASDVLAGRTDFAYQLGADSYGYLENVQLSRVKCLNAYHATTSGRCADPQECYFEACNQLRQTLLNPDIKAAPADFATVHEYLRATRSPAKRDALIAEKARMRWKSRVARGELGTEHQDWSAATEYVNRFYTNVIPAVEKRHRASLTDVMSLFRGKWRDHEMVNCFEAATVIYFFDPDLIRQCCPNQQDLL